ncbi:MAG: hypothetical protein R6V86_04980 [Spirochaetia bacterium]
MYSERPQSPSDQNYHLPLCSRTIALVYHYQSDDTNFIERVRLVVDGKGIKRIEKVDTANPSSISK